MFPSHLHSSSSQWESHGCFSFTFGTDFVSWDFHGTFDDLVCTNKDKFVWPPQKSNLVAWLYSIPSTADIYIGCYKIHYFTAFQITTTNFLMLPIPFHQLEKDPLLEFVLNTQNHFWSRHTGCAFSNLWVLKLTWSQFCLCNDHERRRDYLLPFASWLWHGQHCWNTKGLAFNISSFSLTPHLLGLKRPLTPQGRGGR